MASHLKIKDNEAPCYCSVHQGADIARGTLERVVHPYPLRDAPPGRERLVIVFGYCAGSLCWCSCNRPTCTPS